MRKQILPSPPGTERPPTRRLLLVEDDPALALMLSWELEERGIAVSLACTCTDGRTLPQGLAFDTALVDADLPDGDGVVLAQTLARCHPRARVAIFTGHQGIAERLREMNRGCACPVLTKPVTLSHLLWVLGLGSLGPPAHGAPADFSLADDTALPLTKVLARTGLTRRGISGCPRNRHRDSPQPSGGGFRCSARAFIARP